MKRTAAVVFLLVLGAVSGRAQTPSPAPTFEVADIHLSPQTPMMSARPASGGGAPRDGVYRIWSATHIDLIRVAYGAEADKILGGPHWLELDRFDIVAKVAPGTTREGAQPMLRALLAERFALVVKEESKAFPVYALARGDGEPKLRMATAGTAAGCPQSLLSAPVAGERTIITLACKSTSMAALAQRLASSLSGKPVTDATGIAGDWDFEIPLPTPMNGTPDVKGVIDAVAKSLALKLEERLTPMPVITIEKVNRTPTPNSSAVAVAFPAGPEPEFEVADIRPSPPGAQPRRQILPTGQLTGSAVSVRQMLGLAYQLPDNAPIVGPKALDAPLWDIIAKISSRPLSPEETDVDAVTRMMRRLLADRFNLKARLEDQPMDALTLVAAGTHKLTKPADPDARTKCMQSSVPGTSFPSTQLKCQNMSLAELAERLQRMDYQQFRVPVTDQTGIEGRWDFTLTFTPEALLRSLETLRATSGAPAGTPTGQTTASDPSGAMTLAEAFPRQLGLKLEMRRRPVQVLVIDSMDEKPTEN